MDLSWKTHQCEVIFKGLTKKTSEVFPEGAVWGNMQMNTLSGEGEPEKAAFLILPQ